MQNNNTSSNIYNKLVYRKMKKTLLFIGIVAAVLAFSSCKTNMRRDAKRLAHKTEQCFSIIEENDTDPDKINEFKECYDDMEKLMDKYDKKYSDEAASKKFSDIYMEEVRKSDLSDDIKETFEAIYSLNVE